MNSRVLVGLFGQIVINFLAIENVYKIEFSWFLKIYQLMIILQHGKINGSWFTRIILSFRINENDF